MGRDKVFDLRHKDSELHCIASNTYYIAKAWIRKSRYIVGRRRNGTGMGSLRDKVQSVRDKIHPPRAAEQGEASAGRGFRRTSGHGEEGSERTVAEEA